MRLTKEGIPVILGDLIPLIRRGESPALLRVLNTILVCTRALNLGTDANLDPITAPPKVDISDISKYASSFWKELGYRSNKTVPKSVRWKKFHLTTKVGPNSENDNALFRALCDLSSLPPELETSIRNLGGPKLSEVMDILKDGINRFHALSDVIPFWGKGEIRKLSAIKDKEVKVRVIAIGDYWSQTALYPLHSYLYSVLKKIPQDCTFGQHKAPEKLGKQDFYSSIDLSNATDRFPLSLIASVLEANLPKDYVNDWKNIMVGYPFSYKSSSVNYSVGNPMGFYSSWASFAVAHHYVVYYCCRKLNLSWRHAPYCLLGDDIVICHKGLADLYKETIKSLGVDYSKEKTYESPHFFEFAKRLFWKGEEISPFPFSGLSEVSRKYYLLTQHFIEAEIKGWVAPCGVPTMVESYLEMVLKISSQFKRKLVKLSTIYEHVQRIVRGSPDAGALLSKAFRIMGHPHTVSSFVAHNVLENIAVDLFAESNPSTNWDKWVEKGKITLNSLETKIRIQGVLEYPDDSDSVTRFIDNLPTVGVVNNITWDFKDLAKQAEGYSNSTNGTWPLLLKASAYPLSCDILSQRSSFLIARTASKIVKYLEDRAEVLHFYPPEELLRESPTQQIG